MAHSRRALQECQLQGPHAGRSPNSAVSQDCDTAPTVRQIILRAPYRLFTNPLRISSKMVLTGLLAGQASCPDHKEVTMIPNVRITRRALGVIMLASGAITLMAVVFAGDVNSDSRSEE